MSIATALTALADDVTAAKAAITAKGGTAPSGTADMADAIAAIPSGGITPSGKKLITDTSETDVAAFATAQISSDTLLAENIKKDVNILGVVGSFEGGGGGDIVTPWYTVKTAEVTIGANSVNNPQTAVAYFEGIVGEGNVVAVFLKDQKVTYGANELVAIPQALSHTATNVVNVNATLYRMRNNSPASFQGNSGYDCFLYEGSTYAVIYYDTKL